LATAALVFDSIFFDAEVSLLDIANLVDAFGSLIEGVDDSLWTASIAVMRTEDAVLLLNEGLLG